ncbi:auxin response factor 8-like [Phragmites australis]|uniref:auxin response factor 8-like n=1 Tax=Phragmites australis TaxID=29695 RepID=UPI002D7A2867|nr:auxin response factor 8-like [Phragmites australis]
MLTFTELAPTPATGGGEGCVDAQLWLACAGSMCTVPPVGAVVYYFPQGHAEQANAAVDLSAARVPAFVPCRVVAVRFMADPQSDEVFAKIRLVPLRPGEAPVDVGEAASEGMRGGAGDEQPKPASFSKTLTQSDANNGGGFSVPRFCAETIFPELDYRAEPPVQYVYAKDVHGVEWKFRHIYRGTPRRHLLTTGWSNFVNQKKLLAGDSIVFLRGEGGKVHVGLRRAKRGFCVGGGDEGSSSLSGWDHYRGMVRGNASPSGGGAHSNGKVPAEDVVSAASLAAAGQPFEVVHYPRASSPEFCVRAAVVTAAMHVQWCPGIRFKMAFETEDSSRISWFMGTIAGVQAADPVRWPQSPWRLLQVTWDEPELLQNVKRVCPWLVEMVSGMPNLHLPSFSPPRKKPRIPLYTELPFEGQLFDPAFPPNPPPLAPHPYPHHDQNHGFVPFFPFPDSRAAAGIQGARHALFAPSFSDLHINNLQQSLLFSGIRLPDHHAPRPPRISTGLTIGSPPAFQDAPCSLSTGAKKPDGVKAPGLVLFGRAILTEEQIKANASGGPTSTGTTGNGSSKSDCDAEKLPSTSEGSGSGVIQGSPTKNNLSSWRLQWFGDNGSQSSSEFGLEPGQSKVFVESDAVGRNLDLSALGSFEELYTRLSDMFCIDNAELRSHVLYRTAVGEVKHVGDEPFSAFVKSARRITILTDAGSDNIGS